jgi:hypothetical protein
VELYSEGAASIQASSEAKDQVTVKWSPPELTPGGEYLADVTVLQEGDGFVRVRLDVDGRTLVKWRGKASDTAYVGGPNTTGQPGLSFGGGRILLRDVAVRVLDGKASIVR